MINKEKFQEALRKYKEDFQGKWWEDEKFKWEAVKCFQAHWNIEAEDFAEMLKRSLAKTYNLLASTNNFPKQMIELFADEMPEKVKAMFRNLFDENKDIAERIVTFKKQADVVLDEYSYDSKNHFQNENSISTYLWLRYPDKYYIYKFGEVRKGAMTLDSNYSFKKGAYAENLRNFYSFYDEICSLLQADSEMKAILASKLTDSCYEDNELRTLTADFGFYISRKYNDKANNVQTQIWWPTKVEYDPGLSIQDWNDLLDDTDVFNTNSLKIVKNLMAFGGEATCKQLALKYGENINFYNAGSTALAKRVADKTHCTLMKAYDGNTMWWPILYVGKNAETHETGSFVWKIRDELREALKQKGLVDISIDDNNTNGTNIDEQYTKADFLAEVYMTEAKYNRLVNVLKCKKNIILQGVPGVGKTFAAKRLAYALIGEKDRERVEFVQFHQNYAYEDFMMGYKPNEDGGFEMQYGIFYRFCKKAENNPDKDYFFIIDEINRGNMSKIFGELLMLIEKDYRGNSIKLAYQNLSFSVPENIYIIGMMNTADRSLAMIDYALRRRFSFVDMEPGFETEGFKNYQAQLANDRFDALIQKIQELNEEITADPSLGKEFCIGHSYFCGMDTDKCEIQLLQDIIDYDILPMLREYWFDDLSKAETWQEALYNVLK